MELWTGSFWNWLIYPETSSQIPDPASLLSRALAELGGSFPDFVFCLALDDFSRHSPKLVDRAEEKIESELSPQLRKLLGFAHTNCLYGCGFGTRQEVEAELKKLQKSLEADQIANTIGAAFSFQSALASWRWAAQYAVVAQRSKVSEGRGKVYIWEGKGQRRPFDYLSYYAAEEQLCASIRTGDRELALKSAKDMDRNLFEEYQPLLYLRIRLQEVLLRMGRSAIESGVDPKEIFASLQNYLVEVGTQYDYERLQGLLGRAAVEFAEKVWEVCWRQGTDVVQRARRFMEKQLKEDLTLEDIAKQVGTSASYLSRRFKLETGKNITSYLNELRIEEAKRLLLDESLMITDIAFAVGYGSVQHFGRTFNSIVGCSPSSWRQKQRDLRGF
jgi:AraC-like DNA-binding protein